MKRPVGKGGRDRKKTVLVTDGNERSSLAAVRALAEAGYRVMTCSSREHSLTGHSRFSRRSWTVSDPLTRPERYVGDLAEIVQREDVDVVLPMTEPSLLALLPQRDQLAPAILPFAGYEKLEMLLNKEEVIRRAPAHGIAVPRQVIVAEPGTATSASVADLQFPVVLKPSRSVGRSDDGRTNVGVTHVLEASQFESVVSSQPPAAFPLLVQERISGPGIGIFLLLGRDGLIARFAHRRIREKPPSGGVSVLRESIQPDEALFNKARSLLEDFGWEGVAMVEFKVDEKSGQPYLMEVNPRLWGSLQLAIDAGVDFPTLLMQSALGETVSRQLEYASGVRTRWLWGEVDHLVAQISSAVGGSARLLDKMRRAAEAVRVFGLEWSSGANLEVLRFSDPGPFLYESVVWVKEILKRDEGSPQI